MLISYNEINEILLKYNIQINGVLHIGAHDCEELYCNELPFMIRVSKVNSEICVNQRSLYCYNKNNEKKIYFDRTYSMYDL